MKESKQNYNVLLYSILLTIGFLGLCLTSLLRIDRCHGLSTAVWILSFLYLSEKYRTKKSKMITWAVFILGYLLKYLGALSFEWINFLLFLFAGNVLFCIIYIYSFLICKWNKGIFTLFFPLLWMTVYLLAMAFRFPSLIRIDMMFADVSLLMQAESFIGSSGLAFVLLWIFALISFAACNKKILPAAIGASLYSVILIAGMIYLYPNVNEKEYVRTALATGPYVGGYSDFTTLPVQQHLDSMKSCVKKAAESGAEIIVFNEETYEINDTEEDNFLNECCAAARENCIHMLVGFDITDTDQSQDGKSINKMVFIDNKGEILGSYLKRMTIPLLESGYERGDGVIPSHVINAGGRDIKVSYLICYDSNFPFYVNQVEDDTDILFLPSWDWAAVTIPHSLLCRTLAVENRITIVKPTYDGISIAVRPDGTIIDRFSFNDIGYEQVRIVDIPLNSYGRAALVSTEKESYITNIISVEIFSILVCLILLYGNHFENREKTRRNRLYSYAVISCIIALVSDAVSWIFDGCIRLETLLYVSTIISIGMTFIINGIFIFYIAEYVHERKDISLPIPKMYMVLVAIIEVLIVASAKTGAIFTMENGMYHDGPLYNAYVIVNLICTVLCLATIMASRKVLSTHDFTACMSYIVFPWIAAGLNLFFETFSYAYPSIVLSLLTLYIMIQSERQNVLKDKEFFNYNIARHDPLTGLNNRLAYDERLKEIAASENKVGAIFTDVNGLKYANDNFGHEAGDNLLINYAELLCRHFRKDEVFRISGDEFTILLNNVSEEILNSRMDLFKKSLREKKVPMASTGFAYGDGKEIDRLIKLAETDMYTEKEEFYKNFPDIARR